MRRSAFVLACFLALPLAAVADEPSLYLEGTDKVEVKEPPVRVTRPSKDWAFINLDAFVRKYPAAANPTLKARLENGGAGANFYVFAKADSRDGLSSESLGQAELERTRGCFKDKGKLVSSGHTHQQKLDAFGFEVEGTLNSGGDPISVAKLVVFRPGDTQVFILWLEVPLKNAWKVKSDKPKLFAGVQLQ